ncbi:MAG: lytic transglycosylase domain-containing protein [archaeon]
MEPQTRRQILGKLLLLSAGSLIIPAEKAYASTGKYLIGNWINSAIWKINLPEELDYEFLKTTSYIESGHNPLSTSKKGARGLFQIIEENWDEFGRGSFDNAFLPVLNIQTGIKVYKWMLNYCTKKHPDWPTLEKMDRQLLLAAAYNGGPSRLNTRNWDISRMDPETRNHVSKFEKILNP